MVCKTHRVKEREKSFCFFFFIFFAGEIDSGCLRGCLRVIFRQFRCHSSAFVFFTSLFSDYSRHKPPGAFRRFVQIFFVEREELFHRILTYLRSSRVECAFAKVVEFSGILGKSNLWEKKIKKKKKKFRRKFLF